MWTSKSASNLNKIKLTILIKVLINFKRLIMPTKNGFLFLSKQEIIFTPRPAAHSILKFSAHQVQEDFCTTEKAEVCSPHLQQNNRQFENKYLNIIQQQHSSNIKSGSTVPFILFLNALTVSTKQERLILLPNVLNTMPKFMFLYLYTILLFEISFALLYKTTISK